MHYWERGSPSSPSGFRSDRARRREGRSGELRPLPRGQIRETEGRKVPTPDGNLGLGGMRTPFISGGTCGGGTLPRVSREAREVLSSSAAEAAAAATRMDFLSHPNSTVQRCSPQSGGIPPASDAAVAAAPWALLDETNYLVGGGWKGKYYLRDKDRLRHNEDITPHYSDAKRTKVNALLPQKE